VGGVECNIGVTTLAAFCRVLQGSAWFYEVPPGYQCSTHLQNLIEPSRTLWNLVEPACTTDELTSPKRHRIRHKGNCLVVAGRFSRSAC
jgi:hypothetical protein